jgi:hypothetical protein
MESRHLLPPVERQGRAPPVGEQDMPGDAAEKDAHATCLLRMAARVLASALRARHAEGLLVAVDAASGARQEWEGPWIGFEWRRAGKAQAVEEAAGRERGSRGEGKRRPV